MTIGMILVPMVISAAAIVVLLDAVAETASWSRLRWAFTVPVLYILWLAGYLALAAFLYRQLGRRWPKPRRVVFGKGVRMAPADVMSLMTVGACYQGFAVVHGLPLVRGFGNRVLRAYSPSVHLGTWVSNWGYLYDPDLTYIGDRVLIGARALVVAHSVTVRPDGASVYVSAPVRIDERVTIGGDSIVSMGCTIGADAIIEPGSVVAPFTDVPAGEVWGGHPACCRRRRGDASEPAPGATATAGNIDDAGTPMTVAGARVAPRGIAPESVRTLVLGALGLRADQAPEDLSSDTCPAWDSLGQVSIAAAIFDRYGVTVGPTRLFRLRTLQDVADAIAGHAAPAVAQPALETPRAVPFAGPAPPATRPNGSLPRDPEMLPLLDVQEGTTALAAHVDGESVSGEPLSVLIASSFTAQPVAPALTLWAKAFGINVQCRFAGFNRIVETLLNGNGASPRSRHELTVVLTRPEDLMSSSAAAARTQADEILDAVQHAAAAHAGQSRLLVGTLPPVVSAFGLYDRPQVETLRHHYRARLEATAGAEVFDFADVVERLGAERARSNESEVLTRDPYSPELYQRLAIAMVRQIRTARRAPAKVIAIDCDHTIWGGVVGEVGLDGLELGPDGPGRSFQLFQRHLKQLKERGLLLVVVSRNEERDVKEVFANHPGMVLTAHDIAAWRVNWRHKSENLRELAQELNLALDSFVFLDDDPASRLEVETRLPDVHVVPLPPSPADYCETLSRLWLFDGARPTDVDAARTRMAQDEQRRQQERAAAPTLETYLDGLQLRVHMHPAGDRDWPRLAQLTQRTNQFNLSLKRRTVDELKAVAQDGVVLALEAADRFGDYGLIGLCILRSPGGDGVAEVDTLLMSCRALGRGVEDAFFHGIATTAVEIGASALVAPHVEGPRNGQIKDFLTRCGFAEIHPHRWTRSLRDVPKLPAHVQFQRPAAIGQPVKRPQTDPFETLSRASYPLLMLAYDSLLEQMPAMRRSLSTLIASQDESDRAEGEARCSEVLHLCGGDVAKFKGAVSAWVEFSMEYLQRQHKFLQTGAYATTSFDQIRHELYDNEERMRSFYLVALMFSFVFSANYIGYYRFFRRQMLPRVRDARAVCDIGCGHGVYLSQMLLGSPGTRGLGLDISDASLSTTRSLLAFHHVPESRYALALGDLRETLPVPSESQNAATCFEVLEHLDDPRHALEEIHRILAPGAALCVSAAVRMESVDHLYVFNHPKEVRALLSDVGFTVVADDAIPLTASPSDSGDPRAFVDDPRVSLGYIALAVS